MNKWSLISVAAFALCAVIVDAAQTNAASTLELTLVPTNIQGDLPQAFSFVLVNKSDHDVSFPMPSIGCHNTLVGSIHLGALQPPSNHGYSGCMADSVKGAGGVLEWAKQWKILHAGETLRLQANRMQLRYDDQEAGSYRFWAVYSPGYLSEADQKTLTEAGIDFPHKEISTTIVTFDKTLGKSPLARTRPY